MIFSCGDLRFAKMRAAFASASVRYTLRPSASHVVGSFNHRFRPDFVFNGSPVNVPPLDVVRFP
jgi:hypothetical protein